MNTNFYMNVMFTPPCPYPQYKHNHHHQQPTMFTLVQRRNGLMSSMNRVADSIEEANKILETQVTKECKILADLSPEALATMTDGQEFVVKDVAAPTTSTTTTSSSSSASTTEVPTSWKQYRKVSEVVTPAGWVSSEVKAPKTELVAEYGIIQVDAGLVSDFISDLEEKEEAEEDVQESENGLKFIRTQYEVESPKCVDFPGAVVIGNLIRNTLFEEDIQELLSWCFKKSEEAKGTRADILNLIGYIYKWRDENLAIAEKYFRMSAALGYPLAMANLSQSEVHDRAEWTAAVAKTGYNFYWTG